MLNILLKYVKALWPKDCPPDVPLLICIAFAVWALYRLIGPEDYLAIITELLFGQ